MQTHGTPRNSTELQGRTDVIQYDGWHFLAGNQPPGVMGTGGGAGGPAPNTQIDASCKSRGSMLSYAAAIAAGSGDGNTTDVSGPALMASLMDAVHKSDLLRLWRLLGSYDSLPDDGTAAAAAAVAEEDEEAPVPWYGNASLAAQWEALARQLSRTPPSSDVSSAWIPGSGGTWHNQYIFWDVIEQYNSELPYLLPLVGPTYPRGLILQLVWYYEVLM